MRCRGILIPYFDRGHWSPSDSSNKRKCPWDSRKIGDHAKTGASSSKNDIGNDSILWYTENIPWETRIGIHEKKGNEYGICRGSPLTKRCLDASRPQEPFEIIGRLVPNTTGTHGGCREILENAWSQDLSGRFPSTTKYGITRNEAAFLAMLDDRCVGSIRVCRRWNKNAFIDDLAVDRAPSGQGRGHDVDGCRGALGSGQQSCTAFRWKRRMCELARLRFYLKYGFRLGGIDRCVLRPCRRMAKKPPCIFIFCRRRNPPGRQNSFPN
jgi:hypothetical protein